MYQVNLLPPELQKDVNIDTRRLLIMAGAIAGGVILLIIYASFLWHLFATRREVIEVQQQVADLQPAVRRVQELQRDKAALVEKNNALNEVLNRQDTWSDMLDDIDYNMPRQVWLVSLRFGDQGNNVNGAAKPQGTNLAGQAGSSVTASSAQGSAGAQGGKATGNQAPATPGSTNSQGAKASQPSPPLQLVLEGKSGDAAAVGVFLYNLKQLGYFNHIDLVSAKRDDTGILSFTIQATLRGES